jgi:deoxycytidine triphosphate deaminase
MQVSLEEFRQQVSTLLHTGLPVADDRYRLLGTFDPYTDIPSSLLHSGHLASYAVMTGMIEPFDPTALQKPATYLVPLEGLVRYRDAKGEFQRFYLSDDRNTAGSELDIRDELILEPNSLCYVTLQPVFRMPSYLAGRFNLLIRDVYRGLLVGTGPLVDPGFVGRLSIPLHNFTSNRYPLRAREGFVYFEFTKLSWTNGDQLPVSPDWLRPPVAVQPPFPGSKNLRRTIDNYLAEATGGLPAESAVAAEIRRLGETSEAIVRRTRIFTIVGFVAIGGLILTALADAAMSWQVYLGAQQVVQSGKTDLDTAVGRIFDQSRALQTLQVELDQTKQVVHALENRLPAVAPTSRLPAKP